MVKKGKRKKIGLALGSGGFRGPAHIGVLKALHKNGIKIDFISGSSAGAIVAAHYALFKDPEKAEKDILKQQNNKYHYLKDLNFKKGLLSGNTLEKNFSKMYNNSNFSGTKIPLFIVATDLLSGDPFIFKRGNIARAVRASSSLPFTFKPLIHSNKVLVDGGLSDPVPDKILKEMGADIIIAVNLYNKYKINNKKFSLFRVINRAVEISLLNYSNKSINYSDIIINPDTSQYTDISQLKSYFSKKIFLEIIKIAEEATIDKISEIKKLL